MVRRLIEARNVTKQYGSIIALEAATFDITEGITGLLGPNGAGKTTAIKLFLGLIKPTSGFVKVLGEEPYKSVAGRAWLGYMPEYDALPENMTASEFLMHMAQVSGLPSHHARTRTADTLRHVGLNEERFRHIGQYSTGMKQRVKLAQALVHDPVLILLDEPTVALDPAGRDGMLDLINRTAKDFGISIIISTHLMKDIERTADRVIVLEHGQVVEQGPVSRYTSETQDLLIEVDDKRQELIAALSSRGVPVTQNGTTLIVQREDDRVFDFIRDSVNEVEARLRRLAPQRHSLTELFEDRNLTDETG